MLHEWQNGMCSYCGKFCSICNDCQCPGMGWTRYALSSCPGFDTHAGRDRPERAAVLEQRATAWRDRNKPRK
jgi:hypothetical protein